MRSSVWIVAAVAALAQAGAAQDVERLSAMVRMPVREVTVFKDGHAVVLHEGKMASNAAGEVQMDYLPTPVLGTFWVYSPDKAVKVSAVTASQRRVLVERTALALYDLLSANPGAAVRITETTGQSYDATIIGLPRRSPAEVELTDGVAPVRPSERANIVLLKTEKGVSAIPFDLIRGVVFRSDPKRLWGQEEMRNLLTIKTNQAGSQPSMGMMYVQKGIRWIPGYRVEIDGKGQARVKMQATLINEIIDLKDVTANLVVGVPSFAFQETPDPISLQQAIAQLSPYFQQDSRAGFAMSNAIMGQSARMGDGRGMGGGGGGFGGPGGGAQPVDLGPEVGGQEKAEDLFVYTVKHITLKKGARMVVPITEFTVPYKDVFTLELPVSPPAEVRFSQAPEREAEVARMLAAPKVQHRIRMSNKSEMPFTTAPAMIVKDDRVLAQGMMTYAAVGGDCDLTLTTAVDLKSKRTEKESGRTPNAMNFRGTNYGRIDMAGTITLTNYRTATTEVEVTRYVLGVTDSAAGDGTAEMINPYEDARGVPPTPYWWNYYSWPAYWGSINGMGRFTWKASIEAGKSVDLGYAYHYFF